jgi:hypothetical protein
VLVLVGLYTARCTVAEERKKRGRKRGQEGRKRERALRHVAVRQNVFLEAPKVGFPRSRRSSETYGSGGRKVRSNVSRYHDMQYI